MFIRKKIKKALFIRRNYGKRALLIAIINKLTGHYLLEGIDDSIKDVSKNLTWPKRIKPITNGIAHASLENTKDFGLLNIFCDLGIPLSIDYPSACVKSGSREKTILILSHELSRTGAPMVVFEAAKILKKSGYNVIAASPAFDDEDRNVMVKDFTEEGIPVVSLNSPSLIHPFWLIQQEDEYFDALDRISSKVDLIIANSFTTFRAVEHFNGKDIPLIWWLHEGTDTYTNGNAAFFPKKLQRNIRTFCVSEYSKEVLKEFHIDCYADLLSYGVEDISYELPMIESEKISFLLAGSICPRKNQDVLFKALRYLPKELQEKAEFIIIGGHPNDDYFDKITEQAKSFPCVKLFESVPKQELLEKYYRKADCVLVTSIDDPLPVVLTDGMMLSKIILCSDRTGTSRYIHDGENGFVFNYKDGKALAKKLEYIIQYSRTEEMQTVRENGRKIFEEHFTKEVFSDNLISAVEGAITSNWYRCRT